MKISSYDVVTGAFVERDMTPEEIAQREAEQAAYVPPPAPAPSQPTLIATATLQINDGVLEGIETSAGFSMGFALGVGSYWLFFSEPQPNMAYAWNVNGSSGQVNVSSRDPNYMEISASNGGVPADPDEISVQVFRVL